MRIEGDVRLCLPCDFLTQTRKGATCARMNKPIDQVTICTTGQMVRLPERGIEMHELLEKSQLKWRIEGEVWQNGRNR